MTSFENRHLLLDARSLAFHRTIAEKILADPKLIEVAKSNIFRWRQKNGEERWMLEWLEILDWPVERIVQFLCESSDDAIRLRHSSPFTGILTQDERAEISSRFKW